MIPRNAVLLRLALLSSMATAALVVTFSTTDAGSPPTDTVSPIRVISVSHRVDFPDGVVFTLQAEGDAEITRITLFYQLAEQVSPVYSYPSFDPDARITAEFRLQTSRGRYVPSGIDIGYHYIIEDAAGNTFQTARYEVAYRDPAFDWRELTLGEVTILYHDISDRRVREVTEDVISRLELVKEVLGVQPTRPATGVIINTRQEAELGFPIVSQAASRGHLYAGFAFSDFGVFALLGLDRDSMIHEMTHLLMDEAVDNPLAQMPAWLNEGLAMHFEKDSFRRRTEAAQAARDGRFFPLRNMNAVPGRPEAVRLFYAQSLSVVDFMFEVYGPERITELIRAIDRGRRAEEAIPEVFGITVDQLERAWMANLVSSTPVATRPDLGTIASSLLIVGAIVVAAVAAFVRWAIGRGAPPRPEEIED